MLDKLIATERKRKKNSSIKMVTKWKEECLKENERGKLGDSGYGSESTW